MSLRREAVIPELWWDFKPGDRVMTCDGIPGVVARVEDGPFPGNEQYIVDLDDGMGGGQYTTSMLTMSVPIGASDIRRAAALAAHASQRVAQMVYMLPVDIAWRIKAFDASGGVPFLGDDTRKPESAEDRWQYALQKLRKGNPDPIEVGMVDGEIKILDGNHRAAAAYALRLEYLPANMTRDVAETLLGLDCELHEIPDKAASRSAGMYPEYGEEYQQGGYLHPDDAPSSTDDGDYPFQTKVRCPRCGRIDDVTITWGGQETHCPVDGARMEGYFPTTAQRRHAWDLGPDAPGAGWAGGDGAWTLTTKRVDASISFDGEYGYEWIVTDARDGMGGSTLMPSVHTGTALTLDDAQRAVNVIVVGKTAALDSIGLDSVGNSAVHQLASGTYVADTPTGVKAIVCDEIVPSTAPEQDFPGMTERCGAPITHLSEQGFACARGHEWNDGRDGYVETEGQSLVDFERSIGHMASRRQAGGTCPLCGHVHDGFIENVLRGNSMGACDFPGCACHGTRSTRSDLATDEREDLSLRGGFSVRVGNGMVPHDGYMVAQPGTERVFTSLASLDPTDLRHYIDDFQTYLDMPGNFMGGWVDPTDHQVYLDISSRVTDRDQAIALGKSNHQLAIYDLGTGDEIRTARLRRRAAEGCPGVRFFLDHTQGHEACHADIVRLHDEEHDGTSATARRKTAGYGDGDRVTDGYKVGTVRFDLGDNSTPPSTIDGYNVLGTAPDYYIEGVTSPNALYPVLWDDFRVVTWVPRQWLELAPEMRTSRKVAYEGVDVLSHPLAEGLDITIAYPNTGPQAGYAVVHRTGCAHTGRSGYGDSVHVGTDFKPGGDDYFCVSPCARGRKTAAKTASVASTIKDQIGGMVLGACGAREYLDLGNGLRFRFGGGNPNRKCSVTLNALDLYDIEVGHIKRDLSWVVDNTMTSVYADQLPEVIRAVCDREYVTSSRIARQASIINPGPDWTQTTDSQWSRQQGEYLAVINLDNSSSYRWEINAVIDGRVITSGTATSLAEAKAACGNDFDQMIAERQEETGDFNPGIGPVASRTAGSYARCPHCQVSCDFLDPDANGEVCCPICGAYTDPQSLLRPTYDAGEYGPRGDNGPRP